ncbi:MAG: hypothetical protein DMG07_28640 [Acidobacteria bacterium]|nr:MAG: hypothetical protein DMG07_28640 [Acidobacteriota bacterium]
MKAVVADDEAKIGRCLGKPKPGIRYFAGLIAGLVVPEAVEADEDIAEAGGADAEVHLVVGLASPAVGGVGGLRKQKGVGLSGNPLVEVG